MGSSFLGRPNMGGGSSSSKKGKKNGSSSEKPKQPQRGLGVAQLEKIRLHGEISPDSFSSYPSFHHSPYPSSFNQEDGRTMKGGYSSPSSAPYGFHPSMMMGLSEHERASMRYSDSQPHAPASWNPNYGDLDSQHFAQPNITRHFLPEDPSSITRRSKSMGSSSQNSGSSDKQELDLELRLSI
ncbi:PREDICTED: protein SPEAR1 [Tarenaya hassleriana]|uniref:protein SPEAR1 n=1 Tax=Tarenaya hassleriana TaxID=28532 RepID=UPI00053C205C|nr:PREDICTED: protein SPEAR1 [Tarenaya hassleriana]